MRRLISCILVIVLLSQYSVSAFAENESNGILDSVGNGLSSAWEWTRDTAGDAWNWTSDKASQVWDWTTDTATEAWMWTTGTASDAWNWTTNTVSDAADWTGKVATDAWHWTTGTANDAWVWTKSTADDAWTWTCETASNTWSLTSQAVTGTWDDLFGELSEEGPHHLCVSSPLFKSAKLIGEWNDDNGAYMECFTYGYDHEIMLLATTRAEETLPPSVGEMELYELVAQNYESITFVQDVASGAGVRAMAQELRFKAVQEELPVYGRALGVWTDHYIVCFIITSFVPISASNNTIDKTLLSETDEFYDLWLETLSIYETRKYEIEAETVSDNVPAGNMAISNRATANRIFDEAGFNIYDYADKFDYPKGGHGFAAECANDLIDNAQGIFNGQRSKITGYDNAANGSDRMVTTVGGASYQIQTKYHRTAYESIYDCFDDDWNFRYWDVDGKPMQIEVPKDQYDDAVTYMRKYISEGKVKGITNPDEATNIVKKGHITYDQAKRIASNGKLFPLTYDVVNGCIECASSFGISAVVEFAVGMWNGDDIDTALQKSVYTGLEVGGSSFIVSVLSSHLSRTGLNSLLVGSSEALVNIMGPKAAATFVNAFRHGNNIYGAAAMKSAAKLLRSNVITATVSMVVVSVPDVVDSFRGRISGKQLMKNLATTGGSIAGGTGGWFGGAALGSMILPGVGTVIGGILGSVVGGFTIQFATDAVTDLIVEDDADEMLDIISKEFKTLAIEYLLSESEAEAVAEELNSIITADELKDMFASSSREMYAREIFLRPIMERITVDRMVVVLPTAEEYQDALIDVMEDIYDETEFEEEVTVP